MYSNLSSSWLIICSSLKINFKLGGINHKIENIPLKDRTMIMGADVTHVGKGQDDACPSQAGVVATRDSNYVHYLASARLQPHNTEVCMSNYRKEFLLTKSTVHRRPPRYG